LESYSLFVNEESLAVEALLEQEKRSSAATGGKT
jgi:hypothetical protein